MGQEHSQQLEELKPEDYCIKDDVTVVTRSTASASTVRTLKTRSSVSTSSTATTKLVDNNGNGSSTTYHRSIAGTYRKVTTTSKDKQSIAAARARRRRIHHHHHKNSKQKANKAAAAEYHNSPFALHGLAVEPLDAASLQAVFLGCMASSSKARRSPRPLSSSVSSTETSKTTQSCTSSNTTTDQSSSSQTAHSVRTNATSGSSTTRSSTTTIAAGAASRSTRALQRPSAALAAPPLGKQLTFQPRSIAEQLDYRTLERLVQRDDGGESLPPPHYETEMKIYQYIQTSHPSAGVSRPIDLPQAKKDIKTPAVHTDTGKYKNTSSNPKDVEYLSKLYDLRTWNMHKRITNARQGSTYKPNKSNSTFPPEIVHIPADFAMIDDSPNHQLIFTLDME